MSVDPHGRHIIAVLSVGFGDGSSDQAVLSSMFLVQEYVKVCVSRSGPQECSLYGCVPLFCKQVITPDQECLVQRV